MRPRETLPSRGPSWDGGHRRPPPVASGASRVLVTGGRRSRRPRVRVLVGILSITHTDERQPLSQVRSESLQNDALAQALKFIKKGGGGDPFYLSSEEKQHKGNTLCCTQSLRLNQRPNLQRPSGRGVSPPDFTAGHGSPALRGQTHPSLFEFRPWATSCVSGFIFPVSCSVCLDLTGLIQIAVVHHLNNRTLKAARGFSS